MIESINKGSMYKLTSIEEQAIDLYARQRWNRLKRLLNSYPETEVLFFTKLSMFTKQHEYDSALNLLLEKEMENPVWYLANKHYFHLHRALNKFKKTGNKDDLRIKNEISDDFIIAININGSCLLSNALLALKLANDIDLESSDNVVQESNKEKRNESLKLIWKAMNIYEERERSPQPISLITGLTIPCTYSFLLDIYGYVLFKNGKLKFAKALFIQCLYQDPSFSATYLHLAEWYIENYNNGNHKNDHWKKAAKLNLHIAILNEKLDVRNENISIIADKAMAILRTL